MVLHRMGTLALGGWRPSEKAVLSLHMATRAGLDAERDGRRHPHRHTPGSSTEQAATNFFIIMCASDGLLGLRGTLTGIYYIRNTPSQDRRFRDDHPEVFHMHLSWFSTQSQPTPSDAQWTHWCKTKTDDFCTSRGFPLLRRISPSALWTIAWATPLFLLQPIKFSWWELLLTHFLLLYQTALETNTTNKPNCYSPQKALTNLSLQVTSAGSILWPLILKVWENPGEQYCPSDDLLLRHRFHQGYSTQI